MTDMSMSVMKCEKKKRLFSVQSCRERAFFGWEKGLTKKESRDKIEENERGNGTYDDKSGFAYAHEGVGRCG